MKIIVEKEIDIDELLNIVPRIVVNDPDDYPFMEDTVLVLRHLNREEINNIYLKQRLKEAYIDLDLHLSHDINVDVSDTDCLNALKNEIVTLRRTLSNINRENHENDVTAEVMLEREREHIKRLRGICKEISQMSNESLEEKCGIYYYISWLEKFVMNVKEKNGRNCGS